MAERGFTENIAAWGSEVTFDTLPDDVVELARQCLLDWFGVTLAGSREPTAQITLEVARAESPAGGPCTVVGTRERLVPSAAALVNGTASHALDYDDANTAMLGHATVPVLGALLPLAEARREAGDRVVAAFVTGYEVECRVARAVGRSHYQKGFHTTGTIGTLGAAGACANLLGLDGPHTAIALGLACTQAAGLKAMFGTMAKPLHAGKAAVNGLLAAQLAAAGFTGAPDAVEAPRGLADAMGGTFDAARGLRDLGDEWSIRENLFKYHAACFETHSTIEGVRALREQHGFGPDDVERVVVHASPLQLGMCAIPEPVTGLETKFSLRHTAALAVIGADTSAIESFGDDRAGLTDVVAVRDRVVVEPDGVDGGGTPVELHLRDGRVLENTFDTHVPSNDLDGQRARLEAKAERLAAPVVGAAPARELLEAIRVFEKSDDVGDVMALAATEG